MRALLSMAAEGPARVRVRYPARIPVDEGVELRLVEDADAEEIYRATDADRAYLREWLPWVEDTRSVEDTRTFIARSQEQARLSNGFQTRILYQGRFAGMIGYLYHDWTDLRTEIGYWLRKGLQGRGIMTRAVKTLADFALRNLALNRVEIRAATDNRRSRAIPERLGFVQEGVLRQAAWLDGRFVDLAVYARLRKDPPGPEAPRSL